MKNSQIRFVAKGYQFALIVLAYSFLFALYSSKWSDWLTLYSGFEKDAVFWPGLMGGLFGSLSFLFFVGAVRLTTGVQLWSKNFKWMLTWIPALLLISVFNWYILTGYLF